jgi:hypothetical protein
MKSHSIRIASKINSRQVIKHTKNSKHSKRTKLTKRTTQLIKHTDPPTKQLVKRRTKRNNSSDDATIITSSDDMNTGPDNKIVRIVKTKNEMKKRELEQLRKKARTNKYINQKFEDDF